MENYDVIVVGCGLSGAVIARQYAEKKEKGSYMGSKKAYWWKYV